MYYKLDVVYTSTQTKLVARNFLSVLRATLPRYIDVSSAKQCTICLCNFDWLGADSIQQWSILESEYGVILLLFAVLCTRYNRKSIKNLDNLMISLNSKIIFYTLSQLFKHLCLFVQNQLKKLATGNIFEMEVIIPQR